MQPMVMTGSIAGVFFLLALPAVVIQGCLTVLLAFLTVQSFFKARQLYRKENAAAEKAASISEALQPVEEVRTALNEDEGNQ